MPLKYSVKTTLGSVCFLTVAAVSGTSYISAQTINGQVYDAPRYPAFLSNPTPEEMLVQARIAVRQIAGRSPLGLIKRGETVHVILDYGQDMDVWNAVKAAWAERGVTAKEIWAYEILGMSREKYFALARACLVTGADGWKEWKYFDPKYAAFLPKIIQDSFGKALPPISVKTPGAEIAPYITYLKKHPEVKNFYAFLGGRATQIEVIRHQWPQGLEKYKGNFIFIDKSSLMSKVASFPAEVWKMTDEEMVRPIPRVSEGWMTDPEGTRLHWTQTREQNKQWDDFAGVANHNPNHLNLYPQPWLATWPEGGVIRAEANHTAYYPTMTAYIDQHGRLVRIVGGGRNGDLFRMMLANPKFKNMKFPGVPDRGYWYLNSDGYATNPKAVRDYYRLTTGAALMANGAERERADVQHFAFSPPVTENKRGGPDDLAGLKAGLPISHTAHMHNYFSTIRWRLRDTGEIVTIADKGHPTIFNSPELRALASKYGNPDSIFSYDWVPDMPGVNETGNHDRDYGADPWSFLKRQWALITSGKYPAYVRNYKVGG